MAGAVALQKPLPLSAQARASGESGALSIWLRRLRYLLQHVARQPIVGAVYRQIAEGNNPN
jgi:hypothetical protein